MADKKISQLSAASTPLAGTEVLPLVQSGSTVKVASDDLTVKNVRSNATTGILQIAGPAAAATRTMTVPDANFTVARTDAANSFTDDQTLATGNLVIGTAGKGIDFSADGQAAGMTSELLDDYEEGTWTPEVADAITGGNLATLSATSGNYTKVGRQVTISMRIVFSSVAGMTAGNTAYIRNLPFTPGNASADRYSGSPLQENITFADATIFVIDGNGSVAYLYENTSAAAGAAIKVSDLANNSFIAGSITYFV